MSPPPETDAKSWLTRLARSAASLRAAILLTVVFGILIPSGYALYDEAERLHVEHNQSLQDEIGHISRILSLALRDSIWQFAPEESLSILEATMTDPKIVSIQVRNNDGQLFAERHRPVDVGLPRLAHSEPVIRGGTNIGSVTIEISTGGYQEKWQKTLQHQLRRTGLSLLGSVILILLLLHIRLVRPIERLVGASARLASGELSSPILEKRRDELGRLAIALESTRQSLVGLISTLEEKNEKLIEANDRLESRVAERTGELETTLTTLKLTQHDMLEGAKLASLGRVVAGMAHELNTPIGNALTVATTIEENLKPLRRELAAGNVRKSTLQCALEEADEGFEILLRSLGSGAQIIGDFKQVAVDQTSEKRRTFDLATVTREVLATLQPEFRRTPFLLESELGAEITCDSYPGPYGQVLSNLVLNALSHAFENRESGVVSVCIDSPSPGRARLVVTDNGIGMDENVLSKIYEPFFTTRLGRGGSGLGMHIVYNIVVALLGGRIDVQSSPGHGTRCSLEFPCIAAETPSEATPPIA